MIIVLIEFQNGQVKKTSLESLGLASQLSAFNGLKVKAICIGSQETNLELGSYGADEVVFLSNVSDVHHTELSQILVKLAQDNSAQYVVMSLNSTGKSIAGVVASKLHIALISGVVDLRKEGEKILFKKSVFSGKASVYYSTSSGSAVLATMPNGIPLNSSFSKTAMKSSIEVNVPA
ncbi:MAG: hypothetical protein ABIO44_03925, partial [Saprospiraceae bacterium]